VNGGTFRPYELRHHERARRRGMPIPRRCRATSTHRVRVFDTVVKRCARTGGYRTGLRPPAFGTVGVVTAGAAKNRKTVRLFRRCISLPRRIRGHSHADGLVNGNAPCLTMANFMSIEASEACYPLEFDEFRAARGFPAGQESSRRFAGTQIGFVPFRNSFNSRVLGDPPGITGVRHSGRRTGRAEAVRPARPSGGEEKIALRLRSKL